MFEIAIELEPNRPARLPGANHLLDDLKGLFGTAHVHSDDGLEYCGTSGSDSDDSLVWSNS
jgi:hypothetical protein